MPASQPAGDTEPVDPFAAPTDTAVDPFAAPPRPDGSQAVDPFSQPDPKQPPQAVKVEPVNKAPESELGQDGLLHPVEPKPEDARPISVISFDKDFLPTDPEADVSMRDFRPHVYDANQLTTPEEQARLDAERDAAELGLAAEDDDPKA